MIDKATYQLARKAIDEALTDGVKHLVDVMRLAPELDDATVERFTTGLTKLTASVVKAREIVDDKLKTAAI